MFFLDNITNKNNLFTQRITFKNSLNFLIPITIVFNLIVTQNSTDYVLKKIINFRESNSTMARTFGVFHTAKYILRESPWIGFGLGGENVENKIKEFEKDFTKEVPNSQTHNQHDEQKEEWKLKTEKERLAIPEKEQGAPIRLSTVNSFVIILFFGGIIASGLFSIYFLQGFGINKFLIAYIFLLCSTGSIFNAILFLSPSFARVLKINKS